MQRAKIKNKKQPEHKASTHFIMNVIMPCVMLACKDEFKVKDQSKLESLAKRIQHYIDLIADGHVSEAQLNDLMRIKDIS